MDRALGQIAIAPAGKSCPNRTWLDIGGEDKNSQLRPFGSQVGDELKPLTPGMPRSSMRRSAELSFSSR